ncbi:MAG: hypothetical protein ACJ739_11490 [Acidimicrobiales bacterium]
MPRRDRHVDELQELCRAGSLSRAIDLAFTHFADFGPDEVVLAALAEAVSAVSAPPAVRRRFSELRSYAADGLGSCGARNGPHWVRPPSG